MNGTKNLKHVRVPKQGMCVLCAHYIMWHVQRPPCLFWDHPGGGGFPSLYSV